jgi:hypothetical protein
VADRVVHRLALYGKLSDRASLTHKWFHASVHVVVSPLPRQRRVGTLAFLPNLARHARVGVAR